MITHAKKKRQEIIIIVSRHCPSRIGYQMWAVKGSTTALLHMWAAVRVRELRQSGTQQLIELSITTWQNRKEAHSTDVAIPNSHTTFTAALPTTTEVHRLERRAYKYVATERGLYITILCYPQTALSHINCTTDWNCLVSAMLCIFQCRTQ